MNYLSLFSGMECAHQAWAPLGWHCRGVAEIEPAACQLLAHRLPGVPNLGSVTDITDDAIAALGPLDVVIGGSPCQDLSVAGKRKGLAGARSSLFHEQLRIFHAARHLCGARWLIWENVPGAFSSNAGRDFAVVAGSMAGLKLTVPRDGWGTEGVAAGVNGLVEWAVLDAQWFGVAQRRRRVFAVLDTGDWAGRAPVLLERESLRGDTAPRRETGQGTAGRAGAGAAGGGQWPADVAATLNCAFADKQGLEDQHALSGASLFVPSICGTLTARSVTSFGAPEVDGGMYIPTTALALTAASGKSPLGHNRDDNVMALQSVAHTLRADGFDASEDGTGRGTPLVPIAFPWQVGGTQGMNVETGDVCGTLVKNQTQAVSTEMAVRRLTPRECERLQGVEDDWTLVPNKHGKPMADGPRYKMLGNSFARPVITWIGQQIQAAHEATA